MDSGSAKKDESGPHSMRIATHGKISALVTFALKFLKENPTRPLILHTLPVKSTTREESQTDLEGGGKKQRISPATNDVPRLISVVEIIKREFKGASLHQYNEVGCLEALESGGPVVVAGIPNNAGEERQAALEKALEGKHYLPIKRTPYMKITLSQAALPESGTKGATYQSPTVKKPSRSAKSRNRRRTKKDVPNETEGDEDGNNDAMDIVPT
ncbi:hypothetical protein BDV93DRAFT_609115 [Ceratobasidium sp. AG-I]|nr:hypothetical protein BDV93DRAFT_609115 [Ceratobasidium sp. AG-I]